MIKLFEICYHGFLWLIVGLFMVLTWVTFQPTDSWYLALLNHGVIQYVLLLALLLVLVLLQKTSLLRWAQILAVLFLLAIYSFQVLPFYMPSFKKNFSTESTIKLLSLNVFGKFNKDVSPTVALIEAYKPDVLTLNEYTPEWQQELRQSGVLKQFPYQVEGRSHIATYSRFPIKNSRHFYNQTKLANDVTLETVLDINGRFVTLWASHPPLPIMKYYKKQRAHYENWVTEYKNAKPPFILAGDFNATPWSANYKYLLENTKLKDSQTGFGLKPSWPAYIPPLFEQKLGVPLQFLNPVVALFQIPIDHVLVSDDFVVLKREVTSSVGSDHLPVYVELGFRQ